MTEQLYNAESIEVLTGLEPVQRRPGMYTDTTRPNHLAQEVIDNSVDEALAGHADLVQVILHDDQSIEVIDNGRGMPVDIHPEEGVSGVELIMCRLHAGGKFSNKNYQFSGGLHGVGASVVNALSEWMEVVVHYQGSIHRMVFSKGGSKVSALETLGKTNKTGSTVTFKPDEKIFGKISFDAELIRERAQESAFLLKGIKLTVKDDRNGQVDVFQYSNGLINF
ncbi:MAG: DNA topoisomerase IV subunit B, partial [Alishewanella sp. 32-51-5]